MDRPSIKLAGTTLDCKDAQELAGFYMKLLGWKKTYEDDDFVVIASGGDAQNIVFQNVEEYVAPVWPWEANRQQQMAHLDFIVEDLDAAVKHAAACGAKAANALYNNDSMTVMLDPAGHPFCLGKH